MMLDDGLLEDFFQFGYVTTDLDAAMALYRDRFNVPEFMILDAAAMNPGGKSTMRVGLAWIGETMVELIDPGRDPSPLYASALPEAGIRLHHFGYRVRDEERWTQVLTSLEGHGVPLVRFPAPPTGGMEIVYADARPLVGHYLEYIWTKAGHPDFFAHVPRARRRPI